MITVVSSSSNNSKPLNVQHELITNKRYVVNDIVKKYYRFEETKYWMELKRKFQKL